MQPHRIWFGSTAQHPHPQWLITGQDMTRFELQPMKDYALAGFGNTHLVRGLVWTVVLLTAFVGGLLLCVDHQSRQIREYKQKLLQQVLRNDTEKVQLREDPAILRGPEFPAPRSRFIL